MLLGSHAYTASGPPELESVVSAGSFEPDVKQNGSAMALVSKCAVRRGDQGLKRGGHGHSVEIAVVKSSAFSEVIVGFIHGLVPLVSGVAPVRRRPVADRHRDNISPHLG